MIAVDGFMSGDLGIAEAIRLLLGGEQLDILAQRALVALEGENVIGILVEDFLGDVALAADGVGGNDGAFDHQHVEKRRNGDDLVGFVGHLDLAEHEALACREGGHHVDRRFCTFLVGGAARRWRPHPPTPRSAWRPRRRSDAGIPWRRASRKCRRGGRATAFHRGTAETGAETRSSSGRTVQYRRRFPPRRALRASTTAAPLRADRSPCRAALGPENP